MKISNKYILDQLYFGDPKITPLTTNFLEYTKKVNDVITEEFRKEIGANPVKGSSLELRIATAAKSFSAIARRHFKKQQRSYKRSIAQHFFKIKTHIPLREKKVKPNQGPAPSSGPASSSGPDTTSTPGSSQKPPKKPFEECGRTEQYHRVKKLKASAGGDAGLILSTAKSVAKDFDLNRHFVLKKMDQDPNLAADLRRYIEKDLSKLILGTRVVCINK